MADVYVLTGRMYLGNSDRGYGCEDVSVLGVYDNYEKAKEAFKSTVLEIAEDLAESEDCFEYNEDNIFKSYDGGENYGWECDISNHWSRWTLMIPETEEYEYGFWLPPVVLLEKFTINA